MGDAMDRIRAAEARSNAVIERTTELDRHITALERRLRETETRLERFSRETDNAVENLRTLRQTLDGEEAASKSRSEQIRDSHRIPLQMHRWFFPVALTALFFGLLGSFVRAWGVIFADLIFR